jgi:hypothetical protein
MIKQTIFAPTDLPTNRKFGLFFASLFSALAIYAYWKAWEKIATATLIVAILLAGIVLIAPHLLSTLNRFWYQLGMLLGKIVNPIVLGSIFFLMITPIALITRLFDRDELKIKKLSLQSYWVDRSPPGPSSDSFKNQF